MKIEDAAIEKLARTMANAKLGEGDSVRCEGPTEFEINQARPWARRALASLSPAATSGSEAGGEADMRRVCEALGFDPTNHHNAAKCPYCTPTLAKPASSPAGSRVEQDLRARIDELLTEREFLTSVISKSHEPHCALWSDEPADCDCRASSPAGGDVREAAARICEEARPVRGHVIEFDGMQFVKLDDVNSELNKRAAEIRALSPSTSAAEPVAWVANCCHCGRVVDTREEKEGGDKFGCELTDGRWTCSPECWDAVVEPDATPPAPAAVDGQRVKALVWNEYETEGVVDRWDAETALGTFYEISTQFDGYHVAHDCTHLAARIDTLEEAKAAAQADYEARIRACLATDKEGA